jgi:hypothetical protein
MLTLLFAVAAQAEGVQATGSAPDCPDGHDYLHASFGPYSIGWLCIPAEEHKNWVPAAALGGNQLIVRVLVVRGRHLSSPCMAGFRVDPRTVEANDADSESGAREMGTAR